jgi:hypothetical protein
MKNLPSILANKKYKKIKFKILKTQHLLVKAKINDVEGRFILDTGASNSCVGFDGVDLFHLKAKKSKTQATGAGATGMLTQISSNNTLKCSRWKTSDFDLVIIDLTHVNQALMQQKVKPVHGIIGADILINGKAIVDYHNCMLFLKQTNS